jgi:hypothetical protein
LFFLRKWSSSPSPQPRPSTLVPGSNKRKKRKNIGRDHSLGDLFRNTLSRRLATIAG